VLRTRVEHSVNSRAQAVQFRDSAPAGLRAVADALSLPDAPILMTSSICKSGMSFLELNCERQNLGVTEPVEDDAFLIALQLKACPDFDLYESGRLIRPREFDAGVVAIFDLRTKLASDLRDTFHAIDLYLPRKALDALVEDSNAPRIDELRHQPGVALRDPVARDLLLSVRPALAGRGTQTSALFVDHVAMALALHVAHTYGGMRRSLPAAQVGGLAPWQERRAKDLLSANMSGNITLRDLSSACDLSIRHFTRAFRKSTGMAPHAWLLHHKIEKAKGLLVTSHLVLADIALECGFADQSHLARTFQRAVGMGPGAWRRIYRR
jgi:AraC family transcriptional regulator